MGMVRSHYISTPSPIQNSMVLELNNLSFPSPRMFCTKIVLYIGQVVSKKRTTNNYGNDRQKAMKFSIRKNAIELMAQMKMRRIEKRIIFPLKNYSILFLSLTQ